MKKKYSKIPEYWQRQMARKLFGNDNEFTMKALNDLNPEIEEVNLSMKVSSKSAVLKHIEELKKNATVGTVL